MSSDGRGSDWAPSRYARVPNGLLEGELLLLDGRLDVGVLLLLQGHGLERVLALLFVDALLQGDVALEGGAVQLYLARLLKQSER